MSAKLEVVTSKGLMGSEMSAMLEVHGVLKLLMGNVIG